MKIRHAMADFHGRSELSRELAIRDFHQSDGR